MSILLALTLFMATPTSQPADGFQCHSCKQWHDHMPMDLGFDWPDYVYAIPENERAERVVRKRDFLAVDKEYYFARVVLEIPIKDSDEPFRYGLWVSLSEKSYTRALAIYDDEQASDAEPPYFGWVSNDISYWGKTIEMKSSVKLHAKTRPTICLQAPDQLEHPLAKAQRDGLTRDELRQLIEAALHPDEK
jgi:hypothetical protein